MPKEEVKNRKRRLEILFNAMQEAQRRYHLELIKEVKLVKGKCEKKVKVREEKEDSPPSPFLKREMRDMSLSDISDDSVTIIPLNELPDAREIIQERKKPRRK